MQNRLVPPALGSKLSSSVPSFQVINQVVDLAVDMELLTDEFALKDLAMPPYTIL